MTTPTATIIDSGEDNTPAVVFTIPSVTFVAGRCYFLALAWRDPSVDITSVNPIVSGPGSITWSGGGETVGWQFDSVNRVAFGGWAITAPLGAGGSGDLTVDWTGRLASVDLIAWMLVEINVTTGITVFGTGIAGSTTTATNYDGDLVLPKVAGSLVIGSSDVVGDNSGTWSVDSGDGQVPVLLGSFDNTDAVEISIGLYTYTTERGAGGFRFANSATTRKLWFMIEFAAGTVVPVIGRLATT